MIRSLHRSHDGQIRTNLESDELSAVLKDINGTLDVMAAQQVVSQ